MSRDRTLTHNGETLTLTQWAERTGITRNNLHQRLHKGLPLSVVLGGPRPKRRDHQRHTIAGEELTVAEAAHRLGTTRDVILDRIARGWTREQAMTLPLSVRVQERGARRFAFQGEELTIGAIAKRIGMAPRTLRWRLDRGVPFARAIDPTPLPTSGGGVQTSRNGMGPAGEAPRDIPAI